MSNPLGDSVKTMVDQVCKERGEPGPTTPYSFAWNGEDPLVAELVYSLLLWESNGDLADRAAQAIAESVTNLNELRVCDADEIAGFFPRDVPRKAERAARLAASLNGIFAREHALNLGSVAGLPKREARQYLDSLEGLPPFVAARVMVVSLNGHAMPVDDRIVAILAHHGVIDDPKLSNAELISHLERAVRAADAPRVYAALEREAGDLPKGKKPTRPTKEQTPAKQAPLRSRKTKAES